MATMSNIYPKTIILDTKDIVNDYSNKVKGLVNPIDLPEIMTQVIQILLNCDIGKPEYNPDNNAFDNPEDFPFPDIDRLRYKEFQSNSNELAIVCDASHELFDSVLNQLQNMKAFTKDGFPYFFDKFLGKDAILTHLPY